jgi:hypothetical protein
MIHPSVLARTGVRVAGQEPTGQVHLQEIAAALSEPETQEPLAKLGLVVVASTPGGLADRLQRDVPKWGKAVNDSGAVAD